MCDRPYADDGLLPETELAARALAVAAEVAEREYVEEAREVRDVKRLTTTIEVFEEWENSTGRYITLTIRTSGALVAPVTVKHSRKHDRMACFTCLTADACAHARAARRHLQQHPTIHPTVHPTQHPTERAS